jgi:autoinducer 2 (AI-2) kinase
MTKYLMALDAGTGSGRCVITDTRGRQVARSSEEWHYDYPPDIPHAVQFDANEYWAVLCRVIRRALHESPVAPEDIIAVSATCMREGFLLLDANGAALYAGPPHDERGWEYNGKLAEERGREIFELTGHWPAANFGIGRLVWFKEKAPRLFERSKYLLQINEWVLYRLSGERTGEPSNGCAMALFDIRTRDWAWQLIDSLGLPREIFPPVRTAGTKLGEVTRRAAEETGLKAGTPVVVGGADGQCGLVGTGSTSPGQITAVAGTSTPILIVTSGPVFDPEMRTWTRCHTPPDTWCLEANSGVTGNAYRWARDTLCDLENAVEAQIGVTAYELMGRQAAAVPPGAYGVAVVIPRVMDGRINDNAIWPGVVFGLDALRPERTGKAAIIRAFLESVCFALRANCELLEAVSGLEVQALRICGGQTRSPFWMQMEADILGKPVLVSDADEATAVGTAICAAVGAGVYGSFAEAVSHMTRFTPVEPRPALHAEYQFWFERWRCLYDWRMKMPGWDRATPPAPPKS